MKKVLFVIAFSISVLSNGQIKSFRLSDVKLTESSFLEAQRTSYKYVMAHDPDRLLAPFRREAGLEPKATLYGNWENTGLDGHIGGHYLTALAQIVATTSDAKATERLNYMIDELALCQKTNGNGYVGGIPGSKKLWDDVAKGKLTVDNFSLNRKWVPLYNIHKLFSGLRDAYLIGGNAKAKEVLVGLTDWCFNEVSALSDDQVQLMLRSEHGGLNEVFADVADITGDKKYLDLAKRFSHLVILQPLIDGQDKLNGLHANTQIPKIIGFERVAEVAHDSVWHKAAAFFWETVVKNRSVAIGGNSVREHFHPAEDFTSMMEDREGPETCNTYNMMKLAKQLFLVSGDVKYLDFYERAMYNHILSSQNPDHGGLVYFTSMRPRHYRVYSKAETAFWCCVGSGMENHSKYGELIYAHGDNDLYVNLYVPSQLTWNDKGLTLVQEAAFPKTEKSVITIQNIKDRNFTLKLRYPNWVNAGEMKVAVNGKPVELSVKPSGFVSIARKWKKDDKVEVTLPMHTRAEFLPDGSPWAALVHGPFVLAAKSGTEDMPGLIADDSRMGHIAQGALLPLNEAPVLVADMKEIDNLVKPESGQFGFVLDKGYYPENGTPIELVPFYQIHDSRYQAYWHVTNRGEIEKMQREAAAKEAVRLALEARTIDMVSPGEQQPESDHNFRFDKSETGVHLNRHWRHAQGWFSYDMRQPKEDSAILRITYFGLDGGRSFNIIANDVVVAKVVLNGSGGNGFVDVDYVLTKDVLSKSKNGIMTLRFEAEPGSIAGGIYGVRVLKAE